MKYMKFLRYSKKSTIKYKHGTWYMVTSIFARSWECLWAESILWFSSIYEYSHRQNSQIIIIHLGSVCSIHNAAQETHTLVVPPIIQLKHFQFWKRKTNSYIMIMCRSVIWYRDANNCAIAHIYWHSTYYLSLSHIDEYRAGGQGVVDRIQTVYIDDRWVYIYILYEAP